LETLKFPQVLSSMIVSEKGKEGYDGIMEEIEIYEKMKEKGENYLFF
jgi:hypothetical protein